MSVPTAKIRPSGWWYVAGALCIVAGIVAGIATAAVGFVRALDRSERFARFVSPTAPEDPGRFELSKPGKYVVYYEHESVVDGRTYSTSSDAPAGLDVRITDDSGGSVAVDRYTSDFTFSRNGTVGTAVYTFEALRAGRYSIAISADESGPFVIAVGTSIAGALVRPVVIGLLLGFVGFVVGLVLLISTGVRRRQSRRATTQPPPPWSPGSGYHAPPGPGTQPGAWTPPPPPPPGPWAPPGPAGPPIAPPGSLPPPVTPPYR